MIKHCYSRIAYASGLLLLIFVTACGSQSGGPPTSSSPNSQPSLVGTWTGCAFIGFSQATFNNDKTATLDNKVINYTFKGTQIQFSDTPYNTGAYEFEANLSPDSNLLWLTDTQQQFCVMTRNGSVGQQELFSSLVGTWTGNCNENDSQNTLQFQLITFNANMTFTSDATYTFSLNNQSPNGTYTIPTLYSEISNDYSVLGLTFGDGAPEPFNWLVTNHGIVSPKGKQLMLHESEYCFLNRT